MARASVHVMELGRAEYDAHTEPMQSHINVGTGVDVAIRELAELIGKVVGYQGKIKFDVSKPDGTPRKWLDISRLQNLGWNPSVVLAAGLEKTYQSFRASYPADMAEVKDLDSIPQ
jgi:GDP-L-fucose synthase